MNFEDLLGLVVFLGIVVISSIFRAMKEMKKDTPGKQTIPKSKPYNEKRKFEESKETVPKRKVVIRTESESPPPPLPLFEPKPKKGEQNEELWEEEGPKLKPIIIKTELPQKVESPKTKSTPEKREPVFKEVQGKYITKKIDIKPKPKSESVSTMARMGKAEVTAPMQRMSMQPAGHGVINLRENIGNIPQLQWAIIMMEVLSPPKSLRNE